MHIDTLLKRASEGVNWSNVMNEHLKQIEFFQHERLVHLLVTMMIAILTMMSTGIALITENIIIVILTVLFLILLIPYIIHYYTLENEVQKMYKQYDEILKQIRK